MTEKRLDVNSIDDLFVRDELIRLYEENEQLKEIITGQRDTIKRDNEWENKAIEEIKQLKQRNNRQYEQLGRLYNLIEQKDWRALNDILDDFKKCDEQLQKEWGTYGDVE